MCCCWALPIRVWQWVYFNELLYSTMHGWLLQFCVIICLFLSAKRQSGLILKIDHIGSKLLLLLSAKSLTKSLQYCLPLFHWCHKGLTKISFSGNFSAFKRFAVIFGRFAVTFFPEIRNFWKFQIFWKINVRYNHPFDVVFCKFCTLKQDLIARYSITHQSHSLKKHDDIFER